MKIDFVRYDEERGVFELGSSDRADLYGARRGITQGGYIYTFESWYPYILQSFTDNGFDFRGTKLDDVTKRKLDDIYGRRDVIARRATVEQFKNIFRLTPYVYQEDAIQRMLSCDRLLFTIEQGMGKTFISYMSVWIHKLLGKPHKTVVICPRIVMSNWLYEVRKYTDLTIEAYYGNPAERVVLREKLKEADVDIVVTTFDSIIERDVAPTANVYAAVWERMSKEDRERYVKRFAETKSLKPGQYGVLLEADDLPQCGRIIAGVNQRYAPMQEVRAYRREDSAVRFLCDLGFDILIVDEASRCLSTESSRSASVEQLASVAKKVFLLSGTLCVGRPTDLREPCNILSKGILHMSNTAFERTFIEKDKRNNHIIRGYKNLPLLKSMTDPYMVTKTREGERLELPDRLLDTQFCELDEMISIFPMQKCACLQPMPMMRRSLTPLIAAKTCTV